MPEMREKDGKEGDFVRMGVRLREVRDSGAGLQAEDKVSIIVPCVELLEPTRTCIQHIFAHTPLLYKGGELIVVCDKPSRKLLKYLTSIYLSGMVKLDISPEPRGCATAYNIGLLLAEGDYIAIVSNDCFVLEGWLEPLLKALKKHPEWGWVSSTIIDGDGNVKTRFAACTCCLFTREAVENVGLFDERFSGGVGFEDDDLYRRFLLQGYEPHGVSESRVLHPEPQTTMKLLYGKGYSRIQKFSRNHLLFMKKWLLWLHENEEKLRNDPCWKVGLDKNGTKWSEVPWI